MPRGGTRQSPVYEMTRDGFTLLVMGFNGKTALAFKVRYIEEFNRMEAALKAPQAPALPDFTDPGEAAIAWCRGRPCSGVGEVYVSGCAGVVLVHPGRSVGHSVEVYVTTPYASPF